MLAGLAPRVVPKVASGPPAAQTYNGWFSKTSQTTPAISVTGVGYGPAADGRRLVMGVHWMSHGAARALLNATISGVNAPVLCQQPGVVINSYSQQVAFIMAPLDTGTSGAVNLNFASGSAVYSVWVASYSVLNLASDTPIDTATNAGSPVSALSMSIDEKKDGVRFATLFSYGVSSNTTLTNVTERFDLTPAANYRAAGGSDDITADATNRTLTFTISAGNNINGAVAAVSLR